MSQLPNGCEFRSDDSWPPDLISLYVEAVKAYAAGAYTAASMVCRKILMVCACHKGAGENKTFAVYVDYITTSVLLYPEAVNSINAIRNIGNDATHEVKLVGPDDAKRAMKIVTYMLNTIYTFPVA